MRIFKAILQGAFIGVAGVLLHNSWKPFGLIAGLILTYLGFEFVRSSLFWRRYQLIAVLCWNFVVIRAGTIGQGEELLIYSNTYGNLFLIFGFLIAVISIFRKSN
jgi:hypothetical protein